MHGFITESVLNLVSDGIVILDDTGNITFINPAASHLFGYASDEVMGANLRVLLPEFLFHSQGSGEWKVNGTGRNAIGKKKNGATFPLMITISDSSSPLQRQFIAVIREVTEKMKSEIEQESRLQLLQLILDQHSDAIWYKDRNFKYIYMNAASSRLFGLSSTDGQGLTDYDLWPEDKAAEIIEMETDMIESGQRVTLKENWIGQGGEVSYKRVDKIPLRGKRGSIQGILTIVQDFSDIKQLEELYTSFENIIDDTFFEIYVFSSSMKYLYLNKCAAKNCGYSLEEIQKLTTLDVWSDYTEEQFFTLMEPLWENPEKDTLQFETIQKRKDGSHYPVEVKVQTLQSDGPAPTYMAIVQDITSRKKLEEIQRQAERAVLYSNMLVD